MYILKIVSEDNMFEITGKNIINLELKLNLSEYGHKWSHIGDYLFKFYNHIGCEGQPSNILEVSKFQFEFLKLLNTTELRN